MALQEISKRFDKCMTDLTDPARDCADCPLLKDVVLHIGDSHDEHGGITWKIQGCSLMAILDKSLRRKRK